MIGAVRRPKLVHTLGERSRQKNVVDVEIGLVSSKAEELASQNVLGYGESEIDRIVEWDPKKPFYVDK